MYMHFVTSHHRAERVHLLVSETDLLTCELGKCCGSIHSTFLTFCPRWLKVKNQRYFSLPLYFPLENKWEANWGTVTSQQEDIWFGLPVQSLHISSCVCGGFSPGTPAPSHCLNTCSLELRLGVSNTQGYVSVCWPIMLARPVSWRSPHEHPPQLYHLDWINAAVKIYWDPADA